MLCLPVLAAILTACTGTPLPGTPGPGDTTSAPSTPAVAATASACPADPTACAFAAELADALARGDYGAVAARAAAREWTCPGPQPRGAGDAFPLCAGAQPGERRSGILVTRLASEGEVHSEAQFAEYLRRWAGGAQPAARDDFGGGAVRPVSLGCPEGEAAACAERFAVAFSALQAVGNAAPQREVLLFYVERPAGAPAPRIGQTVTGLVYPASGLDAVLRGGSAAAGSPPGFPPRMVFRPWSGRAAPR
jgi:hypothetical protein